MIVSVHCGDDVDADEIDGTVHLLDLFARKCRKPASHVFLHRVGVVPFQERVKKPIRSSRSKYQIESIDQLLYPDPVGAINVRAAY